MSPIMESGCCVHPDMIRWKTSKAVFQKKNVPTKLKENTSYKTYLGSILINNI